MAAALKFNPLSCHSPHADKLGQREGSAGDSYEGVWRLERWGCTGSYLTTGAHPSVHTHTHLLATSVLDVMETDGKRRGERSHTHGEQRRRWRRLLLERVRV